MAIGNRIKSLREKHNLSQLQLAEKVGINNSVLSRIEAGKRDVEDYLLVKFADVFEVSTDYLVGRDKTLNTTNDINVAYFGGAKEELTEEEARRLKEELEMFRLLKEKKMKEKEKNS